MKTLNIYEYQEISQSYQWIDVIERDEISACLELAELLYGSNDYHWTWPS